MKKRKLVFKPLDNVQFHYFLLAMLAVLIPNIALITDFANSDLGFRISMLIINSIIVFAFVLAKIIFWEKYVVDDIYITKYVKKRIVFRIKIKDVEKIFVRKEKGYEVLAIAVVSMLLADPTPFEEKLTNTSIAFKRCEIIKEQKHRVLNSIKPDGYNELFEWCDCYSLRKAKKLCKRLGITPTYVK